MGCGLLLGPVLPYLFTYSLTLFSINGVSAELTLQDCKTRYNYRDSLLFLLPFALCLFRIVGRGTSGTSLTCPLAQFLGKGQSARTCQPSLFFGSISKQQLSNAVVLALTFSYSPHYFYLVSCPHSHDFGSFSPHFSVLVPIALTLDFGSYSPHFSVLFQIALTS